MTKWEIEYFTGYSARVERMNATLLGRADKIASGVQFCAAFAVFANIANTKWAGALMAVISVITFVLQPGNKSAAGEAQAKKYDAFSVQIGSLTTLQARIDFGAIQGGDSSIMGALHNAAEYGELIRRGATPPFKLSLREKCIAWLAGDLPRPHVAVPEQGTP